MERGAQSKSSHTLVRYLVRADQAWVVGCALLHHTGGVAQIQEKLSTTTRTYIKPWRNESILNSITGNYDHAGLDRIMRAGRVGPARAQRFDEVRNSGKERISYLAA